MLSTKDSVYIAMMTSLLIVLGFVPPIPLAFIPVPIVLQNIGVMLIALILGAKKGTYAMILFYLIGLVFPIFSASRTLLPVLTGQTAGYVIAWFFVPMVFAGILKLLPSKNFIATTFAIWITGVLFIDLLGAIWLTYPNFEGILASLIFIPLDTVKAILASFIAIQIKKRGIT